MARPIRSRSLPSMTFTTGPFSSAASNAAITLRRTGPADRGLAVAPYYDKQAQADLDRRRRTTDRRSPTTSSPFTRTAHWWRLRQTFPAVTSVTINSLTNGQPYTFTVAAKNTAWHRRFIGTKLAVVIAGSPVPPASPPTAIPANGSASVSWTGTNEPQQLARHGLHRLRLRKRRRKSRRRPTAPPRPRRCSVA